MNKVTNNLINIEKYKDFLRKSGLSEDEITSKVESLDSNLISDFLENEINQKNLNIDKEISENKDSAFVRLKNTFMPLFFKDYNIVKNEKGSFLKRTMVNGLVSDDFLSSQKYSGFMDKLYSLSRKFGLNISSIQKRMNNKVENLIQVEGSPQGIHQFNKEINKVAEENNLQSANISNMTSDESIVQSSSVNRPSVKELYQKDFGYVITNDEDIYFPSVQGTPLSNQFSFINNNLLKNLKASLISELKLSDKLLMELKNNNINKLLDKYISEVKYENPDLTKDKILSNLKNNIDIPESSSKSLLINNKTTILNSVEDLQMRIDTNLDKISHLIEVMNMLPRKVNQIPEKEVSLLLRSSRNKFVNNLHNISLPNGETFLELSKKYFDKKGQIVTSDDGMLMHSHQIDNLKTVSETVNQKAILIRKMVEDYIQQMKEKTPIVEQYLKEFANLTNKYLSGKHAGEALSDNEIQRLKFLKDEIDLIEINKNNFQNDLYEQKEELQTSLNKIRRVMKSDKDLSASEFKKVKEYNDKMCGGLSLASRNMVTKGFLSFDDAISSQLRQHTALINKEVDMIKAEASKVQLLLNEKFIYNKSILDQDSKLAKDSTLITNFVLAYENTTDGVGKLKGQINEFLDFQKQMKESITIELDKKDVDYDILNKLHSDYLNKEKEYNAYYSSFLKDNKLNMGRMNMYLSSNYELQKSLKRVSSKVNNTISILAKEENMIARLNTILENQVVPDMKRVKNDEELNQLLNSLKNKIDNQNIEIKKIEKADEDIFNFDDSVSVENKINSQFNDVEPMKPEIKKGGLFGSGGSLGMSIEEKLEKLAEKEEKAVNSNQRKI